MALGDLISAHAGAQDALIAVVDAEASERRRNAAIKQRDKALVALALYRPANAAEGRRKRKYLDAFDLHGDDLFSQLILTELCRAPKAREVRTVAEVIAAFHGVRGLSKWSGESVDEIRRWRRWGFIPHGWHWRMENALRSRGYALSPQVFDLRT